MALDDLHVTHCREYSITRSGNLVRISCLTVVRVRENTGFVVHRLGLGELLSSFFSHHQLLANILSEEATLTLWFQPNSKSTLLRLLQSTTVSSCVRQSQQPATHLWHNDGVSMLNEWSECLAMKNLVMHCIPSIGEWCTRWPEHIVNGLLRIRAEYIKHGTWTSAESQPSNLWQRLCYSLLCLFWELKFAENLSNRETRQLTFVSVHRLIYCPQWNLYNQIGFSHLTTWLSCRWPSWNTFITVIL